MINLTEKQWQVLLNILGAVETGGQQYGQCDYSDYTEAYANSSAENSITIGAFQEFNWLAKGLLQDIKDQYPDIIAKYDDAGIAEDLKLSSWNGYSPSKTSAKAKAIINIINSPEGRKVQDERFISQMKEHIAYGEKKGVTDISGLLEVCNIAHQGGYAAVDRILAKTQKPYTADTMYAALCTDTGTNQVGTYKNRQQKVYEWIKKYLDGEEVDNNIMNNDKLPIAEAEFKEESAVTAEDILNIMRSWIGLNQYDGSHMQIINVYNNYRPLARNYALNRTDSWCAATVSTAFITANAVDLIGGTECSVERFVEDCFKPKGIWIEDETIIPLPGDIICFNWGGSHPNTGWADHIGIIEKVENGTIHTIEGNSGGYCRRRQYPIGYAEIRGFARPQYGSGSSATQTNEGLPIAEAEPAVIIAEAEFKEDKPRILKRGMIGADVKTLQRMLTACDYDCGEIDGDFGPITEEQLIAYQHHHKLLEDGEYGNNSRAMLEKSYDNAKKNSFPSEMYTIKEPNSYLRSGASKNKQIIKKLPLGTKVKTVSKKTNSAGNLWYKCEYGSYTGWIVAIALRY